MVGTPFGPEYPCLAIGKQEIVVSESYDGVIPEFYKRYKRYLEPPLCQEKSSTGLTALFVISTARSNMSAYFSKSPGSFGLTGRILAISPVKLCSIVITFTLGWTRSGQHKR